MPLMVKAPTYKGSLVVTGTLKTRASADLIGETVRPASSLGDLVVAIANDLGERNPVDGHWLRRCLSFEKPGLLAPPNAQL